ncbi:hypothetical protein IFM89_010386 [Coptis chinensis]|uniref:2Fe-2S ferredoxin-type domain-containing protein n=1 Tax=Coptis chinensis TaxID=261450 RepID=A0A835IV28_9MAGN|nr:hypothetical protein IFM89_010386 [Coptis chinensis]
MNMAKSKLAQVGSSIVKELTRGQYTTIRRRGYMQGPYTQHLQSLGPDFGNWLPTSNCTDAWEQMLALFVPFFGGVLKRLFEGEYGGVTRRRNSKVLYYFILQKSHAFSTSACDIAHGEGNQQKVMISVTFMDKDGEEKNIEVPVGMSMLEAAHENEIELEGKCLGILYDHVFCSSRACEGSLACSTCHVIVRDGDYYNRLEEPNDEENDMLDLAFGLTETSRLGCQVIAKPELDGIRLALPAATRNFAVDGHVPKPH